MKTTAALVINTLIWTYSLAALASPQASQSVGQRPYELDWANRTEDDHPPLVDFEDLTGWGVDCRESSATFQRSREQQIWGDHVGKLTYRAVGDGQAPQVRIQPPQPIPVTSPFDAVTLWVYGNNWGWRPDPNTPQVQVTALFADPQGAEFGVFLYQVDFTEWFLMHRRLSPDQIRRVQNGARFLGLLISGGRNREDRTVFFDNLAVFTESFPPLEFEPRPARGIPMFAGQSVGNNTGPGTLPFPNRPETILPDNLTRDFETSVRAQAEGYAFTYRGADGTLIYRLEPRTGTWSDLSARWIDPVETEPGTRHPPIRPCLEGGVWLQTPRGLRPPETAEPLGTQLRDGAVESRWRIQAEGISTEVTYVYRLWNKSLVIDVIAPGGRVGEVRYGRAVGLAEPRLVTNPFYPAQGGRPAVAVSGPPEHPLFLTGNTDWYLSNASILWAHQTADDHGVVYNGGTRYIPKTDGRRNDCFERFFVTVSPRYEEMLPTIPNPVSPWKQITGTHLWRAHGASNRQRDAAFWTECHRWGMTKVVVTDHETGWRDGGESFTFRTRAAPGKGGDQGQFDYARLMQDTLGFVYGPYNNFTDFAPVNEFWSSDRVSRTPDNQLQHAWMRCYAPKPARAVEFCARLAPRIEEKFHFSTAYCDVHTAVAPWHRVDYDPRVPGAGTFSAVFYAFGEIMLLQKQAWDGPVYSEGNYHCFYSGLTDGNYGQDQSYRPAENPWLVDFDLRKIHDLCCNFGMGNPNMFYAGAHIPRTTPEEKDAWIDRFLAGTVAFGHPGFLAYEGGLPNALRSYYMLQQLHSRYCLASASKIRYADPAGRLLDTSRAVATGAYQRSQVVTRYSDGTVTVVNGHPTERLTITVSNRDLDLPPNGYAGWTEDGSIQVLSSDSHGIRSDYAVTPAHLYVDGRGRFVRFSKAAGNGPGICRILPHNQFEILLHNNSECGFDVAVQKAVALDKDRNVLGPASWRVARGLTYLQPFPGAFSYLVTAPEASAHPQTGAVPPNLTCPRTDVFPDEQVVVHGRQPHPVRIPSQAKVGDRLWIQREKAWIDFTIVPFVVAKLSLKTNALRVHLASNLPKPEPFTVFLQDSQQTVLVHPDQPALASFELGAPRATSADDLKVRIRAGDLEDALEGKLRVLRSVVPLLSLSNLSGRGMCLRGQPEQSDFGQTRTQVEPRRVSAGAVDKQALFMHPPWVGGVGYCFARYDSLVLPQQPKAAFRAVVGKGDGSDLGDGILYQVVVMDGTGREALVAERTVTRHAWFPLEADLTPWAGQEIALKLVADVGPHDNSSGDWACWAEMRVETLQPVLHRVLDP